MSERMTVIDLGIAQGAVWQLVIAERDSGAVCLTRENPASETHFEGFHGHQSRRVHDCIVIPAEHRRAVSALLAPEPEPSVAEIEAAAKAWIAGHFGHADADAHWAALPESSRVAYRANARNAIAAARAARQTGGATE